MSSCCGGSYGERSERARTQNVRYVPETNLEQAFELLSCAPVLRQCDIVEYFPSTGQHRHPKSFFYSSTIGVKTASPPSRNLDSFAGKGWATDRRSADVGTV